MPQFVDLQSVENLYNKLKTNNDSLRAKLNRPLTLTEKILFNHLYDAETNVEEIKRGESDIELAPDRVAMQDATAQMAVLQFMSVGVDKVATPTSVHADHLVRAEKGADDDLANAKVTNKEVYDFLSSAAKKYGMDFWEPGSGIIHQIFLENYAFPGGLVIGTDSHTPTGGGLGMIAIGVGGADAVDVMTAQPWQIKMPKIVGVHLKGKLSGWATPKDIILKLCGMLTVKGGTGKILEYFGEGVESISCTGKSTITNMGAELGATTSIFPYDQKMSDYLSATGRSKVADLANQYKDELCADSEIHTDPSAFYDEVIEIDLNEIEPLINGPHSPDAVHALSTIKEEYPKLELPENIAVCLIGSCTNSSYEDISRAASVVQDAMDKGLELKTHFLISPGSKQIAETMKRDGFTEIFEKAGGKILSNTCGPCIGQWERTDPIEEGEVNVIVNSFNRNFKKRNDGRTETHAFVASPEMVVALAFAGNITFNPLTDTLTNKSGEEVKLDIPSGMELPSQSFEVSNLGCIPPAEDGSNVEVLIDPESIRIQRLEPFEAWNLAEDFENMFILVKAQGKCTTDHISPAGKWLKFRGHLNNISNNMFCGAVSAFDESLVGEGRNAITGDQSEFNQIARSYKEQGIKWIAIGDENYGEGSSREHAAMEPRYLGCAVVIAKSFARIAETNLKKQGILPLWLNDPNDYEKFQEQDRVSVVGMENIAPGKDMELKLVHADGSEESIEVRHSLNEEQIEWLKYGSALNVAGEKLRKINV